MATPRKRTTTRRRTTRRRTTSGSRRRRPKLATTLGSVAALALIAGFTRLGTWGRVGLGAALVALVVGYFLWSRRGDIYDEMQTDRQEQQP